MRLHVASHSTSNHSLRNRFAPLILAISLLISACSTNSNSGGAQTQDSTTGSSSRTESLVQPNPSCTADDYSQGSRLITGQLKAFGKKDLNLAYTYASPEFRSRNSLEQFTFIISSQYQMLFNIKTFTIGECENNGELYLFKVFLTDNSDVDYRMEYLLSQTSGKWGVEAAAVTEI